jgi:hypothetical protein
MHERAVHRLIAANPDLDPGDLAEAYYAMGANEEKERPRPYGRGEREAHELMLAYLHEGARQERGNAQDRLLRTRQRRLAEDAARTLWLQVHP